jgi:hypothetical protein
LAGSFTDTRRRFEASAEKVPPAVIPEEPIFSFFHFSRRAFSPPATLKIAGFSSRPPPRAPRSTGKIHIVRSSHINYIAGAPVGGRNLLLSGIRRGRCVLFFERIRNEADPAS